MANKVLSTPYTNRGVEKPQIKAKNTQKTRLNSGLNDDLKNIRLLSKLDIIIDWLQFTIKSRTFEQIIQDFDLNNYDLTMINTGLYGYDLTFVYGEKVKFMIKRNDYEIMRRIEITKNEIKYLILSNIEDRKEQIKILQRYLKKYHEQLKKGSGVHVLLSGYACREFEKKWEWSWMLAYVSVYASKVSRIDIAIDVFDKKVLDIKKVNWYLKNGRIVSKARKVLEINSIITENGSIDGQSITFGSRTSSTQVQFYDKLKERKAADYEVNNNIKYWLRCEIRLKEKSAINFINQVQPNIERLPAITMKALYNLIDIKVKSRDKKRYRWKTVEWWKRFIMTTEKLQLSDKAIQTTITRKKQWLEKSVNKTLAAVLVSDYDYEIDTDINDLLIAGIEKLDKMSLEQINRYRIEKGGSIITNKDLEQIKERLVK